ncbi:MAG TPA: hypothetical protein PKA20_09965 [Burkholderiaceae bacterium]|mgnify:CR=1 FL=1|nr:hypothetical protein [Burkholderiaceae bacterium]
MIDIHCHFLPWVDDGPRDLAVAGAALAAQAADGVGMAVLTPDIHPGRWDNNLSSLWPRFEAFRRYAAAAAIPIDLQLGAQVHLCAESLALVQAGEVPFIGRWNDRPVLLVEFSDAGIPSDAFDSIAFLMSRDIVPMIAHPECNKEVKVAFERMRPFVEAGCLLQLTASSLIGTLGTRAQDAAWRIVEAGWATTVGTGAYQRGARQSMLSHAREALRRRVGEGVAAALLHDNAQAIVDATVPRAEMPVPARRVGQVAAQRRSEPQWVSRRDDPVVFSA